MDAVDSGRLPATLGGVIRVSFGVESAQSANGDRTRKFDGCWVHHVTRLYHRFLDGASFVIWRFDRVSSGVTTYYCPHGWIIGEIKNSFYTMSNETLVEVESVSKKFCRDLKKSLFYGVCDIASELNPLRKSVEDQSDFRDVRLRKKEFWAVDDVSFTLKRGECLGLIGHNGAGKSTLLKMLNGLIKPDRGKITMRGDVGALIELGTGFNPILTGRENIFVNGRVLGFSKKQIQQKLDAIVDFAEIGEFIDSPVQNYSSGMKVRLGFAVAAEMEPDVLIIDEVLAVGDIGFRVKCLNKIQKILSNASVIFVSHSMPFVSWICSHCMVLDQGKKKLYTDRISEGIALYIQKFSKSEQLRSGSGEADVKDFHMEIEGSTNHTLVDHNNATKIQFAVQLLQDRCDFSVNLVVYNLEQRPVIEFYSSMSGNYFSSGPDGDWMPMEVLLPPMNLSSGRYYFSILIVRKSDKRILCRYDYIREFTVKAQRAGWADICHTAEWKLLA